jgi:hypothetical protein
MIRTILFCTFALLAACPHQTIAAEEKAIETSVAWEPLLQFVQDILAGKDIAGNGIGISPGAYLVSGNRCENLHGVISGEVKTCTLIEGSSRTATAMALKMNDAEDAAYLRLKTQTGEKADDRYHTIVFMKNSDGRWLVECWHTCN